MTTDREKLIRANFDAYCERQWVTDLEPKLKAYPLTPMQMLDLREEWSKHTQARDWDWWLENTKGVSNAELERETAKVRAEIDAFRQKHATGSERFQRILEGETNQRPEPQASKDRGREM